MSNPAEPSLSARLKRTNLTSQLGESLNKEVILAGWVHDVRVLGGISFLLLRDMSGIVQVTAPKAKAPAGVLKEIAGLHQEDVLFVRGTVVSSKIAKRGIEVIPSEIEVVRSEEHTSELQSPMYLVCRLLLEKKNIHLDSPRFTDLLYHYNTRNPYMTADQSEQAFLRFTSQYRLKAVHIPQNSRHISSTVRLL